MMDVKLLINSLWPGWRRLLNVSSSAALAVANLVLSLLLLSNGLTSEFGSFAMLQVSAGLAYGITNALLGAPLLIFLNQPVIPPLALRGFFLANLLLALLLTLGQVALVYALDLPAEIFWHAGTLVLLGVIRWFGRSYCLSVRPLASMRSDWVTAFFMLLGALWLWFSDNISLTQVLMVCWVSLLAGIIALGWEHMRQLLLSMQDRELQTVNLGIRNQGKAALVGALSLEATANGHSYIISLLAGPAAFAPIAAATLLYRPVLVVQGALAMYERPRLASLLNASPATLSGLAARQLARWSLLSWAGNTLLVALLLYFPEHGLWSADEQHTMLTLCLLWGCIMFLRSIRQAPATVAQASDNFALLAKACATAALVTLPVAALLVWQVSAVASLFALLAGELVILLYLYPFYLTRIKPQQSTEPQL
ncbi:hypothetical protein GCM10009092_00810 [Bowmanella denitrificans]|uniref:Polysaccharide biosynthesis protein n=1 Tax=Bowmanella denitrificans TaxID=366582 RepID=A0ABP3GAP7_9ALTE